MSLLSELLTGSPFEWVLQHVRLRESINQADAHSLTLTKETKCGDSASTGIVLDTADTAQEPLVQVATPSFDTCTPRYCHQAHQELRQATRLRQLCRGGYESLRGNEWFTVRVHGIGNLVCPRAQTTGRHVAGATFLWVVFMKARDRSFPTTEFGDLLLTVPMCG